MKQLSQMLCCSIATFSVCARLCLFGTAIAETKPTISHEYATRATTAFNKGNLTEAAQLWQQATKEFEQEQNSPRQVQTLVQLGSAYAALGQHPAAVQTLQRAVAIAEKSRDMGILLLAQSALAATLSCDQSFADAERSLRECLTLAEASTNQPIAAAVWGNLGNVLALRGKTDEALEAFTRSVVLAEYTADRMTAAKSLCNAASTAVHAKRNATAAQLNESALTIAINLSPSHKQLLLLLSCGLTNFQLGQLPRALTTYRQTLTIAEKLGDRYAKTYTLGLLGELAHAQGATTNAFTLTRQAAFIAQELQLPEALYRWEWQLGRLHHASGDRNAAIAAYHRAIQVVHPIRHSFLSSQDLTGGSFRETVAPVFYELTGLLLEQVNTNSAPDEAQRLMREASDNIEQLKSLELEDYLQDECESLVRSKHIETIAPKTAILYIIPLAERTELLVGIGTNWTRAVVPVGDKQLTAEIRAFRSHLQRRTTYEYRTEACQLYQWLIAPIQKQLTRAGIETLVFVPDGMLRTIPMAALHDGQHFLIEQYSIAVSPGLTLLAPHPMPRARIEALIAGLTEPVQNYTPLPHVNTELQAVQRAFGGTVRLNRQFVWPALQKDFAGAQYQLIHLAAHGQINADTSESYILTYDGKITLNQLGELIRPSQYRGRPVELLTLSACDTATGDDRAALGLAGMAIKAGARSALATLWSVHDESTTLLIGEFYTQLASSTDITKAHALQRAQLNVLRNPRFEHPAYWSPYLLMGNWL